MKRERFRQHAALLQDYCRKHGYNQKIGVLWDLSLHSGRRRFVVWNFEQDRAEYAFVASHGSGSKRSLKRSAYATVSNEPDSHLSSVGHALIAERYIGRYGIAYRLNGLDHTNSALRPRCVVLHGWEHTPMHPLWPLPTTGSWGCPVLSTHAMHIIDTILQQEHSIILWAYK